MVNETEKPKENLSIAQAFTLLFVGIAVGVGGWGIFLIPSFVGRTRTGGGGAILLMSIGGLGSLFGVGCALRGIGALVQSFRRRKTNDQRHG
jgi:amino acid transporter